MPPKLGPVSQPFEADTSRYIGPVRQALDMAVAFRDANDDAAASIRHLAEAMRSLPDMRRISVEVTGVAEAIRQVGQLQEALDSLSDRNITVNVRHTGDAGRAGAAAGGMGADPLVLRELRDSSASLDMVNATMGQVEDHLAAIRSSSEASARAAMSQADIMRSGGGGSSNDAAMLAAAALGMAGGGRRGGGGGAAAAAMAAAGRGGGGGGGAGGFVPWAGGGWQAVRFWGMMGAEVASTVVPALVAAGSAAMVGAQGFEQMRNRASALYTVNEALGGSLGKTMGQYLGLGNTLQKAQDAATGTVYGLGGAGLNILKSGAGGAFVTQGTNTLDMISRGMAAMTLNVTKGQTGKQVAGLMSGGTEYLRQFGDIGANLGHVLLNVAPALPGVGADLLTTLQGATGAASWLTGHIPVGALGSFMAYEAASRWGPALLGGQGLIGRMLGLRGVGGIGGLLGKGGGALMKSGVPGIAGAGYGLAGLGETLGALAGSTPFMGGLGVEAYLIGKLATMKTPAQSYVGNLQSGIGQDTFAQGAADSISALNQLSQKYQAAGTAAHGAGHDAAQFWLAASGRGGGSRLQARGQAIWDTGVYGGGMRQIAGDYVNALRGIQQVTQLTGTSFDQGTMIAAEAGLQMKTAFDKRGNLTPAAIQQVMNYSAGMAAMSNNRGAFGANVGAVYAAGGLQNSKVSQVNAAWDTIQQLTAGGPAGTAALATLLSGMGGTLGTAVNPKTGKPATAAQIAQALTSFTSPAGAAAWTAFASTSGPSVISQTQAQMDWLRQAQVMGAITGAPATGMGAYYLKQLLPYGARSQAAQAQIAGLAQQLGAPSQAPGQSAGSYWKDVSGWIKNAADSAKQFNKDMNTTSSSMGNINKDAMQFVTTMQSDAISNAAGKAAKDMAAFTSSLKGGHFQNPLKTWVQDMMQGGLPAGFIHNIVQNALGKAGVGGAQAKKIMLQVGADTAQAQGKINGIHGKNVHVNVLSKGAQAAQAAIDAIKGKTVTVTVVVKTINEMLNIAGGAVAGGFGGGIGSLPGGPAGMRIHGQSGMLVPGYGGGDIVPAMLEPGEAVVPKHLVPSVAPFLGAHRVPGFAGGGFVGQAEQYGPASYWGAGSQMAFFNPALLAQLLAALRASQGIGIFARPQGFRGLIPGAGGSGGGLPSLVQAAAQAAAMAAQAAQAHKAGGQFSVQILKGMQEGLKDASPEARKLASALVAKLRQEIGYAQGVAQAAAYGQGYDPTGRGAGIFGSMNLASASGLTQAQLHSSPTGNIANYNAYVAAYAAGTVGGPGPQSVQDQMKSYLGTLKSFGGDLGKLRHEHLDKAVMAQIIAAGPQQGDLIAQSILGGQGGAGAVNKIWAQIQKASRGVGAQAAMSQYGGVLAPDLKSATIVSNNVSISIAAQGGTTLSLSPSQISQLVALIQAKLLQQAKRNPKTGVKAKGKGS